MNGTCVRSIGALSFMSPFPFFTISERRCSLVQAQPYAQSRIRSAKEKEKKGMHLSAILQSPSAKANGAALSPNNDDAADRDF